MDLFYEHIVQSHHNIARVFMVSILHYEPRHIY